MTEIAIPPWLVLLVGRQAIEIEMLRQALPVEPPVEPVEPVQP